MITFEEAVKTGDVAAVEAMLDQDPALLTAVTSAGVSPILMAAYYRQLPVAHLLRARKGALDIFEASALGDLHEVDRLLVLDPHAHRLVSSDGFSPLGYAAYFGHRELVSDLLSRGADPNAASQNDLRVTPLHSALSGGHKEMVQDLVRLDADVNVPSGAEWTPLHYAAFAGDIETTGFLLDHGAVPTGRNSDAKTPADLAAEQGHADIVKLLQPG